MRILLTLTLVMLAITAFGQRSEKVELNWKINPNETLSYQTVMSQIDTTKVEFNFGGLFKALSDSKNENADKALKLFKELNKSFKNIDFVTNLRNEGNGVVDIVMKTRSRQNASAQNNATDNKATQMVKMMQAMNQGIVLRGAVNETGGIHSFWITSKQKNLVSLLFELPEKPVGVGDSWELNINLIANDQNFKCDTAYKRNIVTLTDIKEVNGDKVAVLKYDIVEFVEGNFNVPAFAGKGGAVKTMMKLTHQAVAEFSVKKGRWVSYDGFLGMKTTGYMRSNSKQKLSLIQE